MDAARPDPPALAAMDLALPLAGAALLALGSIGPWATIASFTTNGLEGDGVITLVLAIVAALVVLVARARSRLPSRIALGICGVLALTVAVIDVVDVSGTKAGSLSASVGWGLWVALAGAVILIGAVLARLANRRRG